MCGPAGMTRAARAGFHLRRNVSRKCANTREIGVEGDGGSPARRIARRDDIFMSSGSVLGSSCDGMSTESDLAAMRLAKTLSPPRGSCFGVVTPIKLLRVGGEGFGGHGRGPTALDGLFGRPGEVGGRANRAELTECALRLCVCVVERGGTTCAWSERVLVMEMVTESVSPAK